MNLLTCRNRGQVKRCLEKGDSFARYDIPPVDLAAGRGDLEAVIAMIEFGDKVSAWTGYNAGLKGHVDVVRYLHDHGHSMSKTMAAACMEGHMDVVAYLLSKNIPIDNSSIYWCCVRNQMDILSLLLRAGAVVHVDSHLSPLHTAAKHGRKEAITMLLNHGAYPEYTDRYGDTALHYACKFKQVDCIIALMSVTTPVPNKTGLFPHNYGNDEIKAMFPISI